MYLTFQRCPSSVAIGNRLNSGARLLKTSIVLQNSKVAAPRIFRENKKRETITDSYTLSRGAEIAGEFNARGSVPSRLYTEDAPTARRIFDHLCKTTFATQSTSRADTQRTSRRRQSAISGSHSGSFKQPVAMELQRTEIRKSLSRWQWPARRHTGIRMQPRIASGEQTQG
jgi:hypothetical protein